MRQRVAIARTLAARPQIILMDEPFGALDVQTRLGMQNLINELWEEIEGTILFVTHDIAEAVYLADKIHILSAGPGTIVDEVTVDYPCTGRRTSRARRASASWRRRFSTGSASRPRAATSASRREGVAPAAMAQSDGLVMPPKSRTTSRTPSRANTATSSPGPRSASRS